MKRPRYQAVVIGASTGGARALRTLLEPLPADFPLPILAVLHSAPTPQGLIASLLAAHCRLPVAEAEDKSSIRPGRVWLAPPNYHLLVEDRHTLSLSVDPKVLNVRPAADPLFESAARAFDRHLIGVILTGANSDGAQGLRAIKAAGGYGLVQDPAEAEADAMPRAAIAAGGANRILALADFAGALDELAGETDD